MKQRAFILLTLVVCMTAVSGLASCALHETPGDANAPPVGASARVIVTTDFGKHVVLDAVVAAAPGSSAMDILTQVAQVDTAYGGGFVEGINGIGTGVSGKTARLDWFYSVNGFTARTGAAGYSLRDGDTVHWDYRDWSFRRNVTATLGAFPAAFSQGYGGHTRPAIVAYQDGFQEEAEQLASVLRDAGTGQVAAVTLDEIGEQQFQADNVVIVAMPEAPAVQHINADWDRLGLFVHFEDRALIAYGADGEPHAPAGSGAAVFALQNPWNPSGTGACESVAIVVTGGTEAAVRQASGLLAREYGALVRFAGVTVEGNSWTALP